MIDPRTAGAREIAEAIRSHSDSGGLPIGAQIVGRRWADERFLAITARLAEVAGPFRPPPRCRE